MAASPEQVRAVIQDFVKAWAEDDKKLFQSIFAEDAVWTDPAGTTPFIGQVGVAKFWDFVHQDANREFDPKVHKIIACGNEGILHFTMQIRLPHLNQGLDLAVVDHFVVSDAGKIQSATAYWDETCTEVPVGMVLLAPNKETRE